MEKQIKELLEFIADACPEVARMKVPLNESSASILLELYPIEDLKRQFSNMDNWLPLRQKCRSAFMTCRKWFRADIENGRYKPPPMPNKEEMLLEKEKKEFFRRFEMGSRIDINGHLYEVEENFLHNLESDAYLPISMAARFKNIKKIK